MDNHQPPVTKKISASLAPDLETLARAHVAEKFRAVKERCDSTLKEEEEQPSATNRATLLGVPNVRRRRSSIQVLKKLKEEQKKAVGQMTPDEIAIRVSFRQELLRQESAARKQAVAEMKKRKQAEEEKRREEDRLAAIKKEYFEDMRQRELREERRRERALKRRVLAGEAELTDLLNEMNEGRDMTMEERDEAIAKLQMQLWADFDIEDEPYDTPDEDKGAAEETTENEHQSDDEGATFW